MVRYVCTEGTRRTVRHVNSGKQSGDIMIKYYEKQSNRKECRTIVESCVKEQGKIYVTLTESVFFPEEGGQYADTGWLQTSDMRVRVVNGEIADGQIRYEVEQEIPKGTEATCVLDWEPRYMRMQQHTGEHVLTGLIHNRYGYDNVGFHLSDDAPVTLDLNGTLTWEQAMEMETLANEVIYRNLPVIDSYPTKEELKSLSYRSKIEIEGQVRLITVEGVDTCACCAPHVAKTGEIGLIKIVGLQNHKGGIRISILCGMRALLHYREQLQLMSSLAASLSTRPEQVMTIVANQKEELGVLRGQLAQAAERELMRTINELPEKRNVCIFVERESSPVTVKNGYNAMVKRFDGFVGVFVGDDAHGYRYNAGSGTLDSRELAAGMRAALGAKGGGSREMVQGKTDAKREEIQRFFDEL